MKLYAFDRKGFMSQPHYYTVIGFRGYFECFRHRAAFDDQRMISSHRDPVRYTAKYRPSVVVDLGGMSVHRTRGSDHLAAIKLADRLMAETYAKYRQAFG